MPFIKSLGAFVIGLFITLSGVFGLHKNLPSSPIAPPPEQNQISITTASNTPTLKKNVSSSDDIKVKPPSIILSQPKIEQNTTPEASVTTDSESQKILISEVDTLQSFLNFYQTFLLETQKGIPQALSSITTDYNSATGAITAEYNMNKDSLTSQYNMGESYLARAKDKISLSPGIIKSVEDNYVLAKSSFESLYQDESQQLQSSYSQCTNQASSVEKSNTDNYQSMSSYISLELPIISSQLNLLNQFSNKLSSPLSVSDLAEINASLSQNFPELQNSNYYDSSEGAIVERPEYANGFPANAIAQCNDGTYSFSENSSGTCSSHGGVNSLLYTPQVSDCVSAAADLPLDDLQSQLGL